MSGCPESVYGTHQSSDTSGRCLLCRRKVEAPAPRYNHRSAHATRYSTQDPRWIDGPDEADYLDGL